VQASSNDTRALAAQLLPHWDRFFRFLLNRRSRSMLFRGPAGELTPAQLQALGALGRSDLRMGDLAHDIGLAESSVTRLVDRLVAAGLVERRSTAEDRRRVVAGLTPSGKTLVRQIDQDRRALLVELLEGLEPHERADAVSLFDRLADALATRQTHAQPALTGARS
jgi:DNA-binding MarR family transcriptional regulator